MRYLEDITVGQVFQSDPVTVTAEEIVEFATKYDPQYFHIDEEAAKTSIYGGLIASGWHTCAVTQQLRYACFIKDTAAMGSPGMDELRWLRPMRPGDRLSIRITVQEVRPSTSKPDRGIVRSLSEILNQDGEIVSTMHGLTMIRRRPADT